MNEEELKKWFWDMYNNCYCVNCNWYCGFQIYGSTTCKIYKSSENL